MEIPRFANHLDDFRFRPIHERGFAVPEPKQHVPTTWPYFQHEFWADLTVLSEPGLSFYRSVDDSLP